jgi:hypothetical protein
MLQTKAQVEFGRSMIARFAAKANAFFLVIIYPTADESSQVVS